MEKINYLDQQEIGNATEKNTLYSLSLKKEALSIFSLNTLYRWLTVRDSTVCAGLTTDGTTLIGKYVTAEAPPSKTYTLLTSVHNNADKTDDYNRVIGTAQLKSFDCAKNGVAVDLHVRINYMYP